MIPSRIFSDDKEECIKAIVATREDGDLSIFRSFMTETMIAHLSRDIAVYEESVRESDLTISTPTIASPTKKTRDRVIELLRQNPKFSATALAAEIGISAKGIQRHLANLKAEGILHRIGPDKGGEWQIIG